MIPAGLVLGLAMAAPAQASASEFLFKSEARSVAKPHVRELWSGGAGLPDATGAWIEPARDCDRLSRTRVECDFEIYYEDSHDVCYWTIRIRETRYSYHWRYVYEPECSS